MRPQGNSYHYEPLDQAKQQIRLISIEPAAEGLIKCKIKHVTLNGNFTPDYRALSYVWGPEKPVQQIEVEGQPFIVRQNLHDFLQEFQSRAYNYQGGSRYADEVQWLWVDQICISQSATDERNHQVKLMSEIFKRATYVYAWLGKSNDSIELGMKAMKQHLRDYNYNRLPSARALATKKRKLLTGEDDDEESFGVNTQSTSGTDSLKHLQEFFDNPYWRRLWIVQEILLARYIRIMCGGTLLSWDELSRFCSSGNDNISKGPMAPCISAQVKWLAKHALSARKYSYPSLLWTFSNNECADPRDRVFGLQGLLPERERVKIDYEQSTRAVFSHAFSTMIKNVYAALEDHNCKHRYTFEIRELDFAKPAKEVFHDLAARLIQDMISSTHLWLVDSLVTLGERMGLNLSGNRIVTEKDELLDSIEYVCSDYAAFYAREGRPSASGAWAIPHSHIKACEDKQRHIAELVDRLESIIPQMIQEIWYHNEIARRKDPHDQGADSLKQDKWSARVCATCEIPARLFRPISGNTAPICRHCVDIIDDSHEMPRGFHTCTLPLVESLDEIIPVVSLRIFARRMMAE